MSGEKLLIVDDNALNLRLAAALLEPVGYQITTVPDAEQALAQVQREPPALILMDIQLPGMDGLELTRRLKADPGTRAIVIVALTAYAMKGDEEKARDAGCDDYVTK